MIAKFIDMPYSDAVYSSKLAEPITEVNVCRNDTLYTNFAAKEFTQSLLDAEISTYSPLTAEVGDAYLNLRKTIADRVSLIG